MKFLRGILEETPGRGLMRYEGAAWDDSAAVPEGTEGTPKYMITYYGLYRPSFRDFDLDPSVTYEVEVIDTWNMTVTKAGTFSGKFQIRLPGREYMAVRLRAVE